MKKIFIFFTLVLFISSCIRYTSTISKKTSLLFVNQTNENLYMEIELDSVYLKGKNPYLIKNCFDNILANSSRLMSSQPFYLDKTFERFGVDTVRLYVFKETDLQNYTWKKILEEKNITFSNIPKKIQQFLNKFNNYQNT